MKLFKRKKPAYTYHPNPIGRVELAKRDIYILELKEEIASLRRRIAQLEYRGEYYD